VFLCGVVPCAESQAGKKQFAHVWWAADSSWAVGGFGKSRPGLDEEIMQRKPPGLDGMKAVGLMLNDPGEWLGFGVLLRNVERVVFTGKTKFILTDKTGARVESEAFVFYPDALQTTLYDSRKTPIAVSKSSVWCNPANGYPSGLVKFPAGSVHLKNTLSLQVTGAIADTLRRTTD
jgi:hypothetical protein